MYITSFLFKSYKMEISVNVFQNLFSQCFIEPLTIVSILEIIFSQKKTRSDFVIVFFIEVWVATEKQF